MFLRPQIKKLMKEKDFRETMNEVEKDAWAIFKSVTENVLVNNKDSNYRNIVETMLENFKKLGCIMSVKMHFLHFHIDYFPENPRHYSEKCGERFHRDIKEMENRYWNMEYIYDGGLLLDIEERLKWWRRICKKIKQEECLFNVTMFDFRFMKELPWTWKDIFYSIFKAFNQILCMKWWLIFDYMN